MIWDTYPFIAYCLQRYGVLISFQCASSGVPPRFVRFGGIFRRSDPDLQVNANEFRERCKPPPTPRAALAPWERSSSHRHWLICRPPPCKSIAETSPRTSSAGKCHFLQAPTVKIAERRRSRSQCLKSSGDCLSRSVPASGSTPNTRGYSHPSDAPSLRGIRDIATSVYCQFGTLLLRTHHRHTQDFPDRNRPLKVRTPPHDL